jgi:DHA3 family macrolide efflux protein-like MFS transporter
MEELADNSSLKGYLYFWGGQLISILGSSIVQFVIIVWITVETGSLIILSLANFFLLFPKLIFTPIAGVLSDKYDRKKIILIVDSTQALLTVVLIGFFLINFTHIAVIFSFISLRSICQSFHSPAAIAIKPSMVPKEKLSRINGFNYLFTGLIHIFGAPIGGILITFFDIKYILWIDVITFVIAFIPLILVRFPAVHLNKRMSEKNSFLEDFKIGLKVFRAIPGLVLILFISMIVNFLLQPLVVLMPYYILNLHGASILVLGFIQMLFPAASLVGALIPSFKKTWKNKFLVMCTGLAIINTGYIIYALAPIGFFPMIVLGTILIGFILPIINAISITIFQIVVPKDKIGRVMSIILTLSLVISPLGAFFAGPLSVIFGITNLYLFCAFIGIIIALVSYFFTNLRHIDYDQEIEFNFEEEDSQEDMLKID